MMRNTGVIGLALILSVSCAHQSEKGRSVDFGSCTGDREQDSINGSLRWLAAQQNPDGSWGRDPTNQVRLTSLATLAFLLQGVTPASDTFGKTVEKACSWMIAFAGTGATSRSSMSVDDRALAGFFFVTFWTASNVWTLDECVRSLLPKIRRDPFSVWHNDVAIAIRGSDRMRTPENLKWVAESENRIPTNEISTVVELVRVLAEMMATNSTAEVRLAAIMPSFFRECEEGTVSVEALYLSSQLYDYLHGNERKRWSMLVWNDRIFKGRMCEGRLGWWTRSSLRLRTRDRMDGMQGHDDDIYVTALILLSTQPIRTLPHYYSPVEVSHPSATENPPSTGIRIEVEGI